MMILNGLQNQLLRWSSRFVEKHFCISKFILVNFCGEVCCQSITQIGLRHFYAIFKSIWIKLIFSHQSKVSEIMAGGCFLSPPSAWKCRQFVGGASSNVWTRVEKSIFKFPSWKFISILKSGNTTWQNYGSFMILMQFQKKLTVIEVLITVHRLSILHCSKYIWS